MPPKRRSPSPKKSPQKAKTRPAMSLSPYIKKREGAPVFKITSPRQFPAFYYASAPTVMSPSSVRSSQLRSPFYAPSSTFSPSSSPNRGGLPPSPGKFSSPRKRTPPQQTRRSPRRLQKRRSPSPRSPTF